jgi:hypothetical protein
VFFKIASVHHHFDNGYVGFEFIEENDGESSVYKMKTSCGHFWLGNESSISIPSEKVVDEMIEALVKVKMKMKEG